MSKVAIQGAVTGTGVFTLASPATNTDRTLTLPDEAGTIDTLQRAGNVLQVVQGTTANRTLSTTTTYADTGMEAVITPVASSSKVLLLAYLGQCDKTANDTQLDLRFTRNGVQIFTASSLNQGLATLLTSNVTLSYLDSPSTVSSITYKVQLSNRNAGTVSTNLNGTATIILMEIAA